MNGALCDTGAFTMPPAPGAGLQLLGFAVVLSFVIPLTLRLTRSFRHE